MTVGERIRKKRLELDITQEELAKRMGYSNRSAVTQMEKATDLSLKKIKKVADALGCSPTIIMGWQDDEGNTDIEKVLQDTNNSLARIDAQLEDVCITTNREVPNLTDDELMILGAYRDLKQSDKMRLYAYLISLKEE